MGGTVREGTGVSSAPSRVFRYRVWPTRIAVTEHRWRRSWSPPSPAGASSSSASSSSLSSWWPTATTRALEAVSTSDLAAAGGGTRRRERRARAGSPRPRAANNRRPTIATDRRSLPEHPAGAVQAPSYGESAIPLAAGGESLGSTLAAPHQRHVPLDDGRRRERSATAA